MTYKEAADKLETFICENLSCNSINMEAFQMAEVLLREKAELEDCFDTVGEGKPIWYVDFDAGEIEEGEVSSIQYKDGFIDSLVIDFKETEDCDEFSGDRIGDCLFASRKTAEKALLSMQDAGNGWERTGRV